MKTLARILTIAAAIPVFALTVLDILKDHIGLKTQELIYGLGDNVGFALVTLGNFWDGLQLKLTENFAPAVEPWISLSSNILIAILAGVAIRLIWTFRPKFLKP